MPLIAENTGLKNNSIWIYRKNEVIFIAQRKVEQDNSSIRQHNAKFSAFNRAIGWKANTGKISFWVDVDVRKILLFVLRSSVNEMLVFSSLEPLKRSMQGKVGWSQYLVRKQACLMLSVWIK